MQFDWTTFALEVMNFLVLLWILKRFLYRPVLSTIDARQNAMREQAAAAQAVRAEADAMKTRYEAMLSVWHLEQEEARHALEQELAGEREARLEALKKDIAGEREKRESRIRLVAAARDAVAARQALETAYRKVSAMLQRLASRELSLRIVDIFIEDLSNLNDADRTTLANAAASMQPGDTVDIAVAHSIDRDTGERIAAALSAASGMRLTTRVVERPELIAGVRTSLGECLLEADLADELHAFMERDLHD